MTLLENYDTIKTLILLSFLRHYHFHYREWNPENDTEFFTLINSEIDTSLEFLDVLKCQFSNITRIEQCEIQLQAYQHIIENFMKLETMSTTED